MLLTSVVDIQFPTDAILGQGCESDSRLGGDALCGRDLAIGLRGDLSVLATR